MTGNAKCEKPTDENAKGKGEVRIDIPEQERGQVIKAGNNAHLYAAGVLGSVMLITAGLLIADRVSNGATIQALIESANERFKQALNGVGSQFAQTSSRSSNELLLGAGEGGDFNYLNLLWMIPLALVVFPEVTGMLAVAVVTILCCPCLCYSSMRERAADEHQPILDQRLTYRGTLFNNTPAGGVTGSSVDVNAPEINGDQKTDDVLQPSYQ